MFGSGYEFWMLAILAPATLLASWNDYRTHRVPNLLNALLAASGIAAQGFIWGWSGVGQALAGMGVGFGLLFGLWLVRGMGAGDVKFMAAIGAWLGPELTLYAVAAGGITGGVLAIGMIIARGKWRETGTNFSVLLTKMSSMRTALSEFGSVGSLAGQAGVMPYAIPLTIGTGLAVLTKYTGWWGVL